MRRLCTVVLVFATTVGISAQPLDPLMPENPVVMGRGGSFTATASGYNSFFYNPAGFARGGELTLASANVWAFMDQELIDLARDFSSGTFGAPSASSRAFDSDSYASIQDDFAALQEWVEDAGPAAIQEIAQAAAGDSGIVFEEGDDIADLLAAAGSEDIVAFLEAFEAEAQSGSYDYPPGLISGMLDEIAAGLPSGYLRVGAQAGFGYVGNGLGLGLFANAEATVDGSNILEAHGTAYNTITFVGGLGLTFGNLDVGVAIRPTVFGYTRVNAAPLLGSYLAGTEVDFTTMFSSTVFYGSGLGVDVGARWGLGPFSLGLAVKDLLGTQITYRKTDFSSYSDAILAATLPAGSELSATEQSQAWSIPMKVNAGLEFHPDLGVLTYLIDPSVSVDLLDVTSAVRTWQAGEQVTGDQVMDMLNFGGQLRLLQFLSLRGGYYGGYLSAGVGLDIFLLDINAAVAGDFGRDDAGVWGFTNVGGSVEVGIRF